MRRLAVALEAWRVAERRLATTPPGTDQVKAANEAARRATNAILAVSGVDADPCGLWEFDTPLAMRHAQVIDQLHFRMGLPNMFVALG